MPFSLPEQSVELPPGPVEDRLLRDSIEMIQRDLQALAKQVAAFDSSGGVLRIVGTGGRRAVFGVNTITWPGGVSLSTELTITHGLGTTPLEVLATMQASGQGQVIACHAGAYGATTFKVQAEWVAGFAPGAGGTLPVAWLAVG